MSENQDQAEVILERSMTDRSSSEERCVLCLDEKRSPVSISCGHSFCTECLDVYKSYHNNAWAHRCPICRGSLKDGRRVEKSSGLARGPGASSPDSGSGSAAVEQIYLLEEFMAVATDSDASDGDDEFLSEDDQEDLYYFVDDDGMGEDEEEGDEEEDGFGEEEVDGDGEGEDEGEGAGVVEFDDTVGGDETGDGEGIEDADGTADRVDEGDNNGEVVVIEDEDFGMEESHGEVVILEEVIIIN